MVNIESYIGYDTNGIKSIFIDAEFNENWIPGQSITEIAIAFDDNIVSNGYPNNEFPRVFETIPTKEDDIGESIPNTRVQITKSLSEIVSRVNQPHLFVVYVKVNNDNVSPMDLAKSNCIDQKEFYSTIVYDFTNEVQTALAMVSELDECRCDIPFNYINKILQMSAVKLAIKCGNIEKAYQYFKKFFQKNDNVKQKGCGCHG